MLLVYQITLEEILSGIKVISESLLWKFEFELYTKADRVSTFLN